MFMLKRFTFSLSKNTQVPTSLDTFFSLFLLLHVFSLCLDEAPPCGQNSPNHIHLKKNGFFHIHEINIGSYVVY